MKRLFLILFLSSSATLLFGQFDARFYFPSKEVVEIEWANYKEINFLCDADTVNSVFIRAERHPKGAVLFFHGNALNMWQSAYNARPLVESGYHVMMWDYRGFGKSTGTPSHLNIADDAQLVFEEMMKMQEIAGLPVILYGSSIGIHSAGHIARSNKDVVTGLVLDGAAKSFTELALLTSPEEYHPIIRQYVISPYSIEEDIKYLEGIKILFIHSEDDFIPLSGAQELYESILSPKYFWEYKGPHIQAAVVDPESFTKNIDWLLE